MSESIKTGHAALATVEQLFEGFDGKYALTFRVNNIQPMLAPKEGKVVTMMFSKAEVGTIFDVKGFQDQELFDKVIGAKVAMTMRSEVINDQVVTSAHQITRRVLTIAQKKSGIMPTTVTKGGETGKQPDNETEAAAKKWAEVQAANKGVALDGYKVCHYCDSGKAIGIGESCTTCGRHRIGDDVVVMLPEDERKALESQVPVVNP